MKTKNKVMLLYILLMVGILAISWLTIFALDCWSFDQVPGVFQEFRDKNGKEISAVDLSSSICFVNTFAHGTGIWFNPQTKRHQLVHGTVGINGMGFLLKDRQHVVTATHIITPSEIPVQIDSQNWVRCPIVSVERIIIWVRKIGFPGIGASIDYFDQDNDYAVLKLDTPWPLGVPLPYPMVETKRESPLEDESLLKMGDSVAIIVPQRNSGGKILPIYEIRFGKVTSEGIKVPLGAERSVPWFNLNQFTTDLKVYVGDSGSPIFAFENGKPVIVGITSAIIQYPLSLENYSYFTRIDFIKNLMEAKRVP